MGILLASSISPKAVGVFILIVFIAGICMGPKGTGGSKKSGSKRDDIKSTGFHAADTMSDYNRKHHK